MPSTAAQREQELWADGDPALNVAYQQLDWVVRQRNRARHFGRLIEVTILASSAFTTVAAGLHAAAPVTASLAGASMFLAGARTLWDWREQWIESSLAFAEIRILLHDYLMISEGNRGTEDQKRLIAGIDAVVSAQTAQWGARQRSLAKPQPGPEVK